MTVYFWPLAILCFPCGRIPRNHCGRGWGEGSRKNADSGSVGLVGPELLHVQQVLRGFCWFTDHTLSSEV